MNDASTHGARGQDGANDAKPFFPSEGDFNPVVPFSEIGDAAAPLPPVKPGDVGRPAEADWAREARRARVREDEETLVPARVRRARGERRSWLSTAVVISLSVVAGLASGTYLIRSSQRAPEARPPAPIAAEAPSLPPVAPQAEAEPKVERAPEPTREAQPAEVAKVSETAKVSEAAKAEKTNEVTPAPKPSPRADTTPRAERPARTVAEPREATPAPKPSRTQAAPRPRPANTERRPPAPSASARALPVSTPPPSAKSKKVIQWP